MIKYNRLRFSVFPSFGLWFSFINFVILHSVLSLRKYETRFGVSADKLVGRVPFRKFLFLWKSLKQNSHNYFFFTENKNSSSRSHSPSALQENVNLTRFNRWLMRAQCTHSVIKSVPLPAHLVVTMWLFRTISSSKISLQKTPHPDDSFPDWNWFRNGMTSNV